MDYMHYPFQYFSSKMNMNEAFSSNLLKALHNPELCYATHISTSHIYYQHGN